MLTIFQTNEIQPGRDDDWEARVIRAKHPVMSPDGRAIWNRSEGWFWVTAEIDDDRFLVSIDAEGPTAPWMAWLQDNEGLTWEMFKTHEGAEMAAMLMGMGVAPGQPFFIHMSFSSHTNYFGEYDEDVEWELLDVEKLSPAEAANRWQEWINHWNAEWVA
jgi:hypothetical protein